MTSGRTFWNVFELYFKALFRYENSTSACVLLTCSCGRPRSSRRSLKYRLFDSNLSLIEVVRKKRSVSPLTEAEWWHEEKCMYWDVSVAAVEAFLDIEFFVRR